jgi:hypothetical protein
MQPDLYHNVTAKVALPLQTAGTTGAGHTSPVIDRLGYQGVLFLFDYGSVTATNATVLPTLQECSTTGGTFTSVADADMLPSSGGEALAGIGVTSSRVSGVSKNVVKKLSYRGALRYLKVKVIPTVSAGVEIGVDYLLHSPSHAPAGAAEV